MCYFGNFKRNICLDKLTGMNKHILLKGTNEIRCYKRLLPNKTKKYIIQILEFLNQSLAIQKNHTLMTKRPLLSLICIKAMPLRPQTPWYVQHAILYESYPCCCLFLIFFIATIWMSKTYFTIKHIKSCLIFHSYYLKSQI